MPEEVRLWRIQDDDALRQLTQAPLDLEARLEVWLEHDISILSPGLIIIGRQVQTDFGGIIDLLCLDETGDVVVVELKRDKTPREITAQILDYGSWVRDLSNDQITAISESYLGRGKLEKAFNGRFGIDLPETLNENHRLLIVASQIDPSSERIIKYLSETYDVGINAATFQYFKEQSGLELLARVFLIDPAEVEGQTRNKSKRRRNLTYEELDAVAQEKGVGELYTHAVANFQHYFQKHTTRSSIGFTAAFNGSRKTVLSLIPEDSNSNDGLRFQLYSRRLRTLLNLSEDADLPIIPPHHAPWIYYESAGPDYEGFEGFFSNVAEVDRFSDGLQTLQKPGHVSGITSAG